MNAKNLNAMLIFNRLYNDALVFLEFSKFHPISFQAVLPFKENDQCILDLDLLAAEEIFLRRQGDQNGECLINNYVRCGMVTELDAANLILASDLFDEEFFSMIALFYTNAGMYKQALRWHRESIRVLEKNCFTVSSEGDQVYADTGYCLYSLGLFRESVAWSKSCIGPRQAYLNVFRVLLEYEAKLAGGGVQKIEHIGNRCRFILSSFDSIHANHVTFRLESALEKIAPFIKFFIVWDDHKKAEASDFTGGNPFRAEFGWNTILKHKMNLIFSSYAQADVLIRDGYKCEAMSLLYEITILEPEADFVWDRIRDLENCSV